MREIMIRVMIKSN